MSRRQRAAGLLAVAWAVAAPARAEPAGEGAVRIDASECRSLSADRIVELVSIELSPRSVGDASAVASAPIEVEVVCDAERATMHVRTLQREQPLRLEVPLSETAPRARTRLVALTLSELIVSATLPGAQAVAAPAPEPVEDANPVHPDRASSLLWLAASGAIQGEPSLLTPGLQLGGLADLGPLAVLVDLDGQLGNTRQGVADVDLHALSALAALALRVPLGFVEAVLGAGARVGYARLSAVTSEPGVTGQDLAGGFVGPGLVAALHLPAARTLSLRVGIGFDYALLPVRGLDAAGDALLSLQGPRVTASLGIGLALGGS